MGTKFAFGTTSHKTLPFDLGGLTFFSKPLTVLEELPLSELGDSFDVADNLTAEKLRHFFREQAELIAAVLRDRVQGDGGGQITPDWVLTQLGSDTQPLLLQFLRTGRRPAGSLDLISWLDEPFSIQDRDFVARKLSFAEQIEVMGSGLVAQTGSTADTVRSAAAMLAPILSARAADGQPVEPDWLLASLTAEDLSRVTTLLQSGPEALDPNEPSPEPDRGAAELTISGG